MADPVAISAFMASWFTPSCLFIFLNLVIGSIVLTSRFAAPRSPADHHQHDDQPHLVRSSSLLDRLRSFHFYKHGAAFPETPLHDSPQLVRRLSLIERVRSFNFGFYDNYEPTSAGAVSVPPGDPPEEQTEPQLARTPSLLERLKSINLSSLCRSNSIKAAGEVEGEGDVQESRGDHDSGNLVRRIKSETSKETSARKPEKMKKSGSEKAASRSTEKESRRPETTRFGEGSKTASFGEDEAVDVKANDFINRFKQQLRLERLNSLLRNREMATAN